ncbi:hypothetical protein RCO27_03780 [Sphingosinicella sp. LHD-64]|uniref:hypothetical protein n=1 Tax=Sphingosinicella sp. LHD-64 TaxID=3072139 RepID=UPI00280C7CBF|nr:hypothetical protein [Sphingosinicella sp. LHD-64]MDQ8755340.1 hypothetical protein [Sphingosinicella sp. LHD-64]
MSESPAPPPPSGPPGPGAGRAIALALVGLGAVVLAYFGFFFAILIIGFSFDTPGAHFTDSGLWFRLLALWPPVSLLLVALAAVIGIFTGTLRLLWIALGLFVASIVVIVIGFR